MRIHDILIDGKKGEGVEVPLPKAPLVLARGAKGFVMCGYLNLAAAEKFHDAAAVVRGVANVEELLEKPVAEVTAAALALGVKPGMTGREALKKFL